MNGILLGATKNGEIVFANVRFPKKTGDHLAVSFDCVTPFNVGKVDKQSYAETYVGELEYEDKGVLYDMCCEYDCSPSDLPTIYANSLEDVSDFVDCSLYNKVITVGNDMYRFESSACGQHDTRGEMAIIINPKAYEYLHDLWDEYHLQEVEGVVLADAINICSALKCVDEEEWLKAYILINKSFIDDREIY